MGVTPLYTLGWRTRFFDVLTLALSASSGDGSCVKANPTGRDAFGRFSGRNRRAGMEILTEVSDRIMLLYTCTLQCLRSHRIV